MVSNVLVAIPTYLRPERLERALRSAFIAVAEVPPPCKVSIAVIDNDANRSAQTVAEKFHVTYVCEPVRGISMVRNRALQLARDFDAIAFLDDDEWVATNMAR